MAYAHPEAHTITRWVGADADSVIPTVVTFDATEPGLLVLCTDGLWNYFEDPLALGALIPDWVTSSPVAAGWRACSTPPPKRAEWGSSAPSC